MLNKKETVLWKNIKRYSDEIKTRKLQRSDISIVSERADISIQKAYRWLEKFQDEGMLIIHRANTKSNIYELKEEIIAPDKD